MSGNKRVTRALQERDWKLMRALAAMRVVDREQARIIGGIGSTTRVNEWLLKLTRAGFLMRRFLPLKHGGDKALYSLSRQSSALVDGSGQTAGRKPGGLSIPELFLEHQLSINSIHIILKYHAIPVTGIAFLRWQTFPEPLSANAPLIPDGYFELQTPKGVRASFLEVDLGTEPLRIWKEKIKNYLALASSGEFQQKFGQTQFRVLIVCQSEGRLQSLRKLISAFTEKVFWFSTFDLINRETFWSPIWLRPTGELKQSLL